MEKLPRQARMSFKHATRPAATFVLVPTLMHFKEYHDYIIYTYSNVASAHTDNYINVWSIDCNGPAEKPAQFNGLAGRCYPFSSQPIMAISWFPDSKRIAACTADASVIIHDTTMHQVPRCQSPPFPRAPIIFAVFSHDARLLAYGGRGGQFYVWNVDERKLQTSLPAQHVPEPQHDILYAAFDATGKRLVTCSDNGKVCTWDVEKSLLLTVETHNISTRRRPRRTFPDAPSRPNDPNIALPAAETHDVDDQAPGRVRDTSLLLDGMLFLAASSSSHYTQFKEDLKRVCREQEHDSACFAPDSSFVVSALHDGAVCVWEAHPSPRSRTHTRA